MPRYKLACPTIEEEPMDCDFDILNARQTVTGHVLTKTAAKANGTTGRCIAILVGNEIWRPCRPKEFGAPAPFWTKRETAGMEVGACVKFVVDPCAMHAGDWPHKSDDVDVVDAWMVLLPRAPRRSAIDMFRDLCVPSLASV